MKETPGGNADVSRKDELYEEAASAFGRALGRLARAYEPDVDKSRDLLQEIHFALWRSFEHFDERCSVRTWVYRVAHNVATSQVSRRRAANSMHVDLDELDITGHSEDPEWLIDKQRSLERLMTFIQKLKPLDKQIILLYLDGIDGASIGEITGLYAANVGIKIHRIKKFCNYSAHLIVSMQIMLDSVYSENACLKPAG